MKLAGAVLVGYSILLTLFPNTRISAQSKGEAEGNADYAVGATSAAAQSQIGYIVEKNVMVTMRDGVKLATDIYRPARHGVSMSGKFPVLVDRSPYNKNSINKEGIFFTQHGYVVIAQDCRGRFASQGSFYPLLNEGKDGYDTIEWAGTQPWSNGKVGTIGASYGAWTQYTAAMLNPPHLVAMFPVVGGSQFFPYSNGVPSINISQWILYMAQTSQEAKKLPQLDAKLANTFENPNPWLMLPPAESGEIFKSLPDYEKIFLDMFYTHPTFDNYWKQPNFDPAGYYSRFKDVPMFFISGWYDGTVDGVIENFVQLSLIQKTPKKLMIGPWPHATGKSTCGEAYFGSSAAVDEQALELDWFDHWLKAEPLRVISSDPVQIFRMGGGVAGEQPHGKIDPGGKWLSLKEWPPAEANPVNFYLEAQGLRRSSPPRNEGSLSFEDDPANPVPTRGGRFHGDCVQDQAALEKRADVLTFTTPLLKAPTTIAGKVEAHFWVSSTAPDTDFIAKLSDIYPDGYSMLVAEGQIRVSYRDGLEHLAPPMKRGTVYELTVDMGATSNLFGVGHRIRLDISSTDFPRLEPNSNTDAFPGKWTTAVKARNTIHYGGGYPSVLILPVMSSARTSR